MLETWQELWRSCWAEITAEGQLAEPEVDGRLSSLRICEIGVIVYGASVRAGLLVFAVFKRPLWSVKIQDQ